MDRHYSIMVVGALSTAWLPRELRERPFLRDQQLGRWLMPLYSSSCFVSSTASAASISNTKFYLSGKSIHSIFMWPPGACKFFISLEAFKYLSTLSCTFEHNTWQHNTAPSRHTLWPGELTCRSGRIHHTFTFP